MNMSGVRFEQLNKDNYDTWKIQMRAILIKNDAWGYVSGVTVKPEVTAENVNSAAAANRWTEGDLKAQSDIILAIRDQTREGMRDVARDLDKVGEHSSIKRTSAQGRVNESIDILQNAERRRRTTKHARVYQHRRQIG